MTPTADVLDLVRRWAAAEERNDPRELGELLADDFRGVGPVGFVLGRDEWLARFAGGLANRAFAVEDVEVREYGTAAVVVGVLAQQTSYPGGDNSGRFRITAIAARQANGWAVANVHIGPLVTPGGPGPR